MTLSNKIKQYRQASNLTQLGIAQRLGITKSAVTAWEKGRSEPSTSNLRKLTNIFGIEMSDLFDENSDKLTKIYERPPRKLPNNAQPAPTQPTRQQDNRTRIPIRGYAQGDYINTGNVVKKPIGFLDLAPSFSNIVDLYAVYITGDSMANEHRHGDTRLVAPHSPCKIGDTVVVVKKASGDKPETSYIKTYTEKRTLPSGKVMLHFNQTNPPAELIFEQNSIVQMHKVLTYNELLGL